MVYLIQHCCSCYKQYIQHHTKPITIPHCTHKISDHYNLKTYHHTNVFLIIKIQCSVECGHGVQRRNTVCKNFKNNTVDDSQCLWKTKPIVLKACYLGLCKADWYGRSDWSQVGIHNMIREKNQVLGYNLTILKGSKIFISNYLVAANIHT